MYESHGRLIGILKTERIVTDPQVMEQLDEPLRQGGKDPVTRMMEFIKPSGKPITPEQANRIRELLAKLEQQGLSVDETGELYGHLVEIQASETTTPSSLMIQALVSLMRGEMDILERLRTEAQLQLALLWQEIEDAANDLGIDVQKSIKVTRDAPADQTFQVERLFLTYKQEVRVIQVNLTPDQLGYLSAGGVISNGKTIKVDWSIDITVKGVSPLRNYTQLVSYRDENQKFNWVAAEDTGEPVDMDPTCWKSGTLLKPRFLHYRFEGKPFLQDMFALSDEPQLERIRLYGWEL